MRFYVPQWFIYKFFRGQIWAPHGKFSVVRFGPFELLFERKPLPEPEAFDVEVVHHYC